MNHKAFSLDGKQIIFDDGDTIMDAALRAGHYIPHLCHHPGYTPHGSCRLCVVSINGRLDSACTRPAETDIEVVSENDNLRKRRRHLLQMLFVEGNHICPACEKSGDCRLQALAYDHGMLSPDYKHFFENRSLDASHADFVIDYNRCILCELCVRASRDIDGKQVFITQGRGIKRHLSINSPNNRLGETAFSVTDEAADICPVGAILHKHVGYRDPIGKRRYDLKPIHHVDPDLGDSHEH
jgi:[NiFe] hydrogenase diaphorase moiety small subunit